MSNSGRGPHEDFQTNTPRSQKPDPAVERRDEITQDAVKAASPPAGAAAGAIAGAAAGLAVGAFGPFGAMVGAIVGALGGTALGAAAGTGAGDAYTSEHDAHYRDVWAHSPDRPADRTFESVRPAYQFGHIAAAHPLFGTRHFAEVEPELRERWSQDLRTQAGEWDAIRRYVEEGYSYARSRGVGERRDERVIGTAGSAVDPVELDRARAGLPSTDRP